MTSNLDIFQLGVIENGVHELSRSLLRLELTLMILIMAE